MRFLLSLLVVSSVFATPKIFVVPDYYGYVDTMFPKEPLDAYGNLGVWGKIKHRLKEYGYEIEGSSLKEFKGGEVLKVMHARSGAVEKIVILNVPWYVGISSLSTYPEESLYLIVFEPPSVEPYLHTSEYYSYFHKVLTWDDDRIDGEKFVKFYYPVMYPMKSDLIPFHHRKFCSMIARNKSSRFSNEIYSERMRAISYFEENAPHDFDLYGYGWDTLPLLVYKGSVEDKYAVLKQYKFSICYENTQHIRGYITEKIFDCFHCGVIPVYLGASNIKDYIPEECFIDMRDFSSYEDLHTFLKEMTEEEHEGYLQAIRAFLQSDGARRFSDEYFVETFLREIVGIPHTS